jgi:multiple sugar transport system permease protein
MFWGLRRLSAASAFIYIFLLAMVVISLFPVVYILLASFKTNQEIIAGGVNIIPQRWQVENYIRAWKLGNFGRYTWNSVYMCFFIVVGSIITATIEGYVFSRGTTKFSKFV